MTAAADVLLELVGINRSFGREKVLDQISLVFAAGEKVLLLGANGAGKSTLLKIICGLSVNDGGTLIKNPSTRVGFLGHLEMLYRGFSVKENLMFFGRIFGRTAIEVDDAIARNELRTFEDRPLVELSRGWQVRVALTKTFLDRPNLLLLDEPTAQLDGAAVIQLLETLKSTPSLQTTIIATHDIARLGDWATRIIVLAAGKISIDTGADATPAAKDEAIDCYARGNR